MSPQRLVVLRQVDSERYLPIWVGPYEAESITVALQEIEMIRPLTHDLLKNIITTFEGHVRRVEIVALREDIFYGNLVIESRGQMVKIDARPSDAIALAVRARVPILVDASVMEAAGIIPEQDIQGQLPAQPPAAGKPAPASPPKSDDPSRLSIFEDFLSKLDTDKPADDDKQEPEK
jgi:hypothetical protein